MSTSSGSGVGLGALGFIFLMYAGFVGLIALWTERNLEFWIGYLKYDGSGQTEPVHYGLAYVATFFLPGLSWTLDIVGEIARLFV